MKENKRGPGRPKTISLVERRSKILDAAGDLFIEESYSATNMEQIALRCGMSKKTLYQTFESKEALFAALVCDVDRYKDEHQKAPGPLTPERNLAEVLLQLAEWVLAPRQIGLTRLVIAESLAAPDLAAHFRGHAIEHGRRLISECLNSPSVEGNPIRVESVEELASIAFGAVIADLQLRALVGEDISTASERTSLVGRINRVVKLIYCAVPGG
jgi:AcrR family transcriptional regulator